MPRCPQTGDSGLVAHTGGWAFCPWCGDRLPPPPPPPGTCATCGAPAISPNDRVCRPCHFRRLAVRYANGHDTQEVASRRVGGASWQEIARACGLTRPRRGPQDVRKAAWFAWSAAGKPGAPPRLGREHGSPYRDKTWGEWRAQPAVAAYFEACDAALDRWLAEVAGSPWGPGTLRVAPKGSPGAS